MHVLQMHTCVHVCNCATYVYAYVVFVNVCLYTCMYMYVRMHVSVCLSVLIQKFIVLCLTYRSIAKGSQYACTIHTSQCRITILPYVVKMIDGEGHLFLPEPFTGKPDLSILDEPKFTKNNFVNDLYKLTALGASGPV